MDTEQFRFGCTPAGSYGRRLAVSLMALSLLLFGASDAFAGDRERAKRIHDRLAGVPPTDTVLADMQSDVLAGNPELAAITAMDNPAFYSVTLKNMATPWTNRDQTVFAPLNDYTATFIGMVRDDVPMNTALSADLLYIGSGPGIPAYSPSNNNHYEALENNGVDLQANLQPATQSALLGLPTAATAGLMTTRAAAEAFLILGTNRANFRYTLLNHLCVDMEQVKDTTLIPDRIRQDVSRSPGGDSRIFLNNCVGCHSGMDPLAQAFAYYNFDDTTRVLQYTPGQVQPKYGINSGTFAYGFITPDDSWDNYWRDGQNQLLGWSSSPSFPGSGNGAKSMGEELANSDAFAYCQVRKVFKNVCLRDPVDPTDNGRIDTMVLSFRGNGYRLKQVFAEAAAYCMGD
jgi:hypothetical protein